MTVCRRKRAILGCIADDFTGATDLANNLVRAGMRTVLTVDVPAKDDSIDADAIVVALKSRTISAEEAVVQSLHACRWLRGCVDKAFGKSILRFAPPLTRQRKAILVRLSAR